MSSRAAGPLDQPERHQASGTSARCSPRSAVCSQDQTPGGERDCGSEARANRGRHCLGRDHDQIRLPWADVGIPSIDHKALRFPPCSLRTVYTTKARRARAAWRLLLPGEWGTRDSWSHGQSGKGCPRCRRKVVLFLCLPQPLLFLTRHAAYSSGQGPVRKHTPFELRQGTVRKSILSTYAMVNCVCPYGRATGAREFVKHYLDVSGTVVLDEINMKSVDSE